MSPKYKLTYFSISGLGEPIRYLLSYGNLDFEDNRITIGQWPELKKSIGAPLNQLPFFEFDGKVLFQSVAICRYLATVVGLAGATPLENWEIDAVIDTIIDLRTKTISWLQEKDEPIKQTLKDALISEHFPFYLSKLDDWAKQNDGYLAAGKLTWADLYFVAIEVTLTELCENAFGKGTFLKGYPNLEALKSKVCSLSGIKAWLQRRPPSHF